MGDHPLFHSVYRDEGLCRSRSCWKVDKHSLITIFSKNLIRSLKAGKKDLKIFVNHIERREYLSFMNSSIKHYFRELDEITHITARQLDVSHYILLS